MEQQYVGIDLHHRRSMIVRMNDAGEVQKVTKIDNDPVALSMAIAEAGPNSEVALEATYGGYWAVDLLQAEGARVHLVHPPPAIRRIASRRGLNIASVAAARRLLTLVYYGLRDGEICNLSRKAA